jgi:hypothetical protein
MKKATVTFLLFAAASLLQCLAAESRSVIFYSGAPASRMLESFGELSGLELVMASNLANVSSIPVAVEVSQRNVLERAEALRLIERALLEQAGVIITRLDEKRASVTFNDRLLLPRPGESPLLGRVFRYTVQVDPK